MVPQGGKEMMEQFDAIETIRMDKCRQCKKPVIYAGTTSGKWRCLEVKEYLYRQDPNGDAFVYTASGRLVKCRILDEEDCKTGKEKFTGRGRTPHICAIF
jgi:hypothetical protein